MEHPDFPCIFCGDEGPHLRIPVSRYPGMTDEEWAQHGARVMLYCERCTQTIWEPATGDGLTEPNLTMIRPALRDLARPALAPEEVADILMLQERYGLQGATPQQLRGFAREYGQLLRIKALPADEDEADADA